MNRRRFQKLVSLYLDNEISPEELDDLFAELERNPSRRQLVEQYRRLDAAFGLTGEVSAATVSTSGNRFLAFPRVLAGAAAALVLSAGVLYFYALPGGPSHNALTSSTAAVRSFDLAEIAAAGPLTLASLRESTSASLHFANQALTEVPLELPPELQRILDARSADTRESLLRQLQSRSSGPSSFQRASFAPTSEGSYFAPRDFEVSTLDFSPGQ